VDINEKVSIDAVSKTIEEVLGMLFADRKIKYEVSGKRISIYRPITSDVSSAEKRRITGKIMDQSNEPIIGASVTIPGTSEGTISDIDGNFSLIVGDYST